MTARGLRILDAPAEADADPVRRAHGVPLSVLTAELDVHKTSALRLMQTLVAGGHATPAEGRGGYRLGPAMRPDHDLAAGTERLKRAARPYLEELVARTGECAHAAVADRDRALVIDDVETDQPLRVVPAPGRHVPLHCTSAGKCLLAFGPAELPASLPQRTARTVTSAAALRAHLDRLTRMARSTTVSNRLRDTSPTPRNRYRRGCRSHAGGDLAHAQPTASPRVARRFR